MRRSVIRGGLASLALLTCLLPDIAAAQISAGPPSRLVDLVEATEHDQQVDLVVQFNCSMRYVTHLPASEGSELHVQLLPLGDCGISPLGQIVPEVPPVSDDSGVLLSARLESDAPGQVTLLLRWRKPEQFVIAQGTDPRGLRIRLLRQARTRSKVLLTQSPDSADRYAINLESQPKPFEPAAVQLARERLQLPVFVSETQVGEEKWYRLRAGPLENKADAERALDRALRDYPRAWLAQGDDSVTTNLNGSSATQPALPRVERIGTDPPLPAETLKRMLSDARGAMSARDYTKAITLLTALQRQPEFPDRARAQELLGLTRERAGQLAHAKAEYEEYLRRYPNGEAAERVRARLRILRAASAEGKTAGAFGAGNARGWQVNGGFAQLFRYDNTRFDNGSSTSGPDLPSSQQTTRQNALYTDVDLLARHRGERFDFLTRISAGYIKQFGNDAFGNNKRISLASMELGDRSLGLLARVGRQVRYQDGILGTFDGLFVSYRLHPAWTLNAAAGYPVEQTSESVQTHERFESLALAYAPPGRHWDGSVFVATQQFDGIRDRRAAGFEARYLAARASLITFFDYDVSFKALNVATLLGTVQLPGRWIVSVDAERRNSPVLTTRNALIGQPDTTLAQLEQSFTLSEIYQLARDRTATTDSYSVTATAPLGERFHVAAVVSALRIGATPASGGVDAQPATGLDVTYQAQLYGSSLWTSSDFNIMTLTYGNTEVGTIEALSASSRFPIGGAWRIGPRLTVERRAISFDGSTEFNVLPSVLLDYQRGRALVQLEVGGESGKRDVTQQTENTRRYYVNIGYRIGF